MTATATDSHLSETDFQEQVVSLMGLLGWHHLHVRRTIGRGRKWVTSTNLAGWPDLLAWSPRRRRVLAAELKSERGQATPETGGRAGIARGGRYRGPRVATVGLARDRGDAAMTALLIAVVVADVAVAHRGLLCLAAHWLGEGE